MSKLVETPQTVTKAEIIKSAADEIGYLKTEIQRSVYMPDADVFAMIGANLIGGHVLDETEPGQGKTTLARAYATAVGGGKYGRVQGTSDLEPSDILGVQLYNPGKLDFDFRKGPIFKQVTIIDEINRAPEKTQSALIEPLEERQVTIGDVTYLLPKGHLVIATQNPYGEGRRSPLDTAIKDRFAVGLRTERYTPAQKQSIRELRNQNHVPEEVIKTSRIQEISDLARSVVFSKELFETTTELVAAIARHGDVARRGTVLGSFRPEHVTEGIAKVFALVQMKDKANIDHVKLALAYTLPHRMKLTHEAAQDGKTTNQVVSQVIENA